jgi:YesN/AraC family two-component response regulator
MATLRSLHSFSLLIVEDDKAARDIIANMVGLEFPDYTILTANNGIEGFELFKQYTPDIVITDVNLPLMDGVELARKIRVLNGNATYIVLTAYSDQTIFDKFKDIGVCAYPLKPINFDELFAAIEKCSIESKQQP